MCPPECIHKYTIRNVIGRTHGSAPTGYPGAPRYCTINATSLGI